MSRKNLVLGLLCIFSLLLAFTTISPAQTAGSAAKSALAVPVSGSFAPSTTSGTLTSLGSGTFAGTFNIQRFVNQGGNLTAVGTLIGTLTNGAGQTQSVVLPNVTAPVTAATALPNPLSNTWALASGSARPRD